jgi:2-oxoglutarate dehydrogenase complex dihydrolipoamide succinyltransferase (E2) component
MAREFKLPDLGEGIAEAEIVKWLVNQSDEIKEDQPLVELMTDKATVQIPSPFSGKISQILAKEGQTVKVGETLVVFDGPSTGPATEQVASPASPAKTPPSSPTRAVSIIAAPATRKLAREMGVELERIKGSGPGGRITDDDVRAAASGRRPTEPTPPPEPKLVVPSLAKVSAHVSGEERIALHGIRKRISERMLQSLRTSAQVTHVDEADFTQLIALREKLKPIAESNGTKLTFMPFIMKAAVMSLKEFPNFNSSLDAEKNEIVVKHYYNIGFATDTSSGLIVPVVKAVDQKSVMDIAKDVEELSQKARDGKIALEEIQGGTFTITNIGTLGGLISTPIINTPEVAILGVHKIQKRPVVRDGAVVIRDMVYLALTFDHRVVDGADAAKFTTRLISILENPGLLIQDSTRFV